MNIEVNTRKAVSTSLKDYCYFSGEDAFIEATEWTNGEGWDITINTKSGDKIIALTHGEMRALIVLTNYAGE